MKAILLDGSRAGDSAGNRVRTALTAELHVRGWEVEHILLSEKKIGNCAGDFFCWIRNPGICNVNDDNRAIAASVVNSNLTVYLTPITFGGYSSTLKKMVDHQIQNISPYFAQVNGETHHQRRYPLYPDFLAIGWMDQADAQNEATFRHLVYRNAINFYAEKYIAGVVMEDQAESEIQASVQNWLNEMENRKKIQPQKLPENGSPSPRLSPIRRALLLVGSPRTRQSTSNSLGSYLFAQLNARGIQTETAYTHTTLRSPEKMKALLEAADAADLVMLAFPLYVDSLPAPTIEALERIAAQRAAAKNPHRTHRQLFAAIANCGFPEAHHNATALAICANFARQAGFDWAGSLALGAGEGLVHGMSLNEMDGRVIPLKKALDLAAEALAQGSAIPQEAQTLLAKPFVPAWLYRSIGLFGWKQQAKPYGAEKSLSRQPYLTQQENKHGQDL
jgi:multimeric flavodoxin WrbA